MCQTQLKVLLSICLKTNCLNFANFDHDYQRKWPKSSINLINF